MGFAGLYRHQKIEKESAGASADQITQIQVKLCFWKQPVVFWINL